MTRFFVVLVLFLTACSTLSPSTTADAQKTVYTLRATYAASLAAATVYARLPRCTVAPAPCSDPAVLSQMKAADLAADTATSSAENAVRNMSSNQSVVSAAVQTAQTAVTTFSALTKIYGGK
jgi:hypothetical protein